MFNDIPILALDGNDKIIFSETYNIYENELTIPEFLGYKIRIVFEKTEPEEGQTDVSVRPDGTKGILVTFSKKFRNSLGANTSSKLSVLKTKNDQILLSVYGKEIGDNGSLNVTVNFYLK